MGNRTLLCETVTASTMAGLLAARDASADADMVELRLDGVADLDVEAALAGRRVPAIVTCRPDWEGGRHRGGEAERYAILSRALDQGAEYVDVEWRAVRGGAAGFENLIAAHRDRVIVSSHDFHGVPDDLADRVRAMRETRAALIKVAVVARRLSDSLPLIDIGRGGDAIVIGMGDAGVPTRLLASRFGSRWTYGGNGVAPGQVPARSMVERFRFREVGANTAIYGVVGQNAMQSISPAMHNAAFAAAGIDAVYVPLRAADFGDFLTFADALGIAGASVTIPFKLDAWEAAASADELTRTVGAANTLRTSQIANHKWEATNTDVEGFLEPLDAALRADPKVGPYRGLRVSVLGAGGAARAVVAALESRGARVTVHARREEQARVVTSHTGPWPPAKGSWDVLVNCTPLGGASARDASPLPGGPFGGRLVYDLTYGTTESPLVREARLAGCATLDGLPMLIAQAERQFEWWTGKRAPEGVMRQAARAAAGID
jgi:3-dehydroquinate dehydratase/shikimate dehydrogenase